MENTILLQDIDPQKIEQYAKDIETGKAVYQRFSPQEQRGFTEGGRENVEASIIASRSNRTGETQDENAERQESPVEDYAKSKGIWHDNTEEYLSDKYGGYFSSGSESLVYDAGNGKVVKTSNIDQYRDLRDALDGITIHNSLFPESNIRVIGFGKDGNGDFQIITEQPYIKESRLATQEEIDRKMEYLGLKKNDRDGIPGRYVGDDMIVNDVTPKNVIITPERNLIPIDTIAHLNEPVWGLGGACEPVNGIAYKT